MHILMKRYYYLIILFILIVLFSIFFLGGLRIISYTAKNKTGITPDVHNIENDVELFDNTIIHDMEILLAGGTLIDMIRTYRETGNKDYFHADIIIDGVRIKNVGIRLKGNSTLGKIGGMKAMMEKMQERMGGNGKKVAFEMPDPREMFKNMDPEKMKKIPGFDTELVLKMQEAIENGEPPPVMDIFSNLNSLDKLSADPLPFLIRFDEFEPGMRYQGYRELAIRTGGAMPDPSFLAEPLTNYAAAVAGIPAPETSYSLIKVGDNPRTLFTLTETLDEVYVANYLPNKDGILYKILTGGSLNYRGDDPSSYSGNIELKSNRYNADLAPLIMFMKFISLSSDEDFAENITRWLDINSFVTYLAVHNILANYDSMAGMGNNFYVYYNPANALFHILSWDTNESLGRMFKMGGGNGFNFNLYYKSEMFEKMFEGTANPDAFKNMFGGNQVLFERFVAIPHYKLIYENKLKELYTLFFEKASLTGETNRIKTMLAQKNLTSGFAKPEALENSFATHLDFLKNRQDYIKQQLIMK